MTAAPRPPSASRPPAWATALVPRSAPEISALFASFAAGAALAPLDALVRAETAFAGAWRRRLALKAAAASGEGRAGDEAALRDALALTRPGGDPGPAGRGYRAWRALATDGSRRFEEIVSGLGAAASDRLAFAAALDAPSRSPTPAPIAAAEAARAVAAACPRARPLALAAADLVLAARLGWRRPLPLLALEIGRARADDANWAAACCAAYARAAGRACDLYAELAPAAARLQAVAPKLRAQGAEATIAALLDDDAVSGGIKIAKMSDRGLRRLFDRLVELGAARELTGRSTFRLYGL